MRYRYEYRHGIWHIDLRYGMPCLPMRFLPIRYRPSGCGHPICRYGLWATRNGMGDDSIDTVISHIDIGSYLVTLLGGAEDGAGARLPVRGRAVPVDSINTRVESAYGFSA